MNFFDLETKIGGFKWLRRKSVKSISKGVNYQYKYYTHLFIRNNTGYVKFSPSKLIFALYFINKITLKMSKY